jgi:ssDNA-binding Zn-finger/Zn-ribbon topoisomerase 1
LDVKALEKSLKAGKRCPRCEKPLLERKGPRGKFWGCSGYPACRYLESIAPRGAAAPGPRKKRS